MSVCCTAVAVVCVQLLFGCHLGKLLCKVINVLLTFSYFSVTLGESIAIGQERLQLIGFVTHPFILNNLGLELIHLGLIWVLLSARLVGKIFPNANFPKLILTLISDSVYEQCCWSFFLMYKTKKNSLILPLVGMYS